MSAVLILKLHKIHFVLCDDRWTLESTGLLPARKSALEDDFEEEEEKEDAEALNDLEDEIHEKVLNAFSICVCQ